MSMKDMHASPTVLAKEPLLLYEAVHKKILGRREAAPN